MAYLTVGDDEARRLMQELTDRGVGYAGRPTRPAAVTSKDRPLIYALLQMALSAVRLYFEAIHSAHDQPTTAVGARIEGRPNP